MLTGAGRWIERAGRGRPEATGWVAARRRPEATATRRIAGRCTVAATGRPGGLSAVTAGRRAVTALPRRRTEAAWRRTIAARRRATWRRTEATRRAVRRTAVRGTAGSPVRRRRAKTLSSRVSGRSARARRRLEGGRASDHRSAEGVHVCGRTEAAVLWARRRRAIAARGLVRCRCGRGSRNRLRCTEARRCDTEHRAFELGTRCGGGRGRCCSRRSRSGRGRWTGRRNRSTRPGSAGGRRVDHKHGPLEFRGCRALQIEPALLAGRRRVVIRGPTVRAKQSVPP